MREPTDTPISSPAAPTRATERQPSRTGNIVGLVVCTVALGLLIWAKLQLVAGVPRTAVATPDETTAAATDPHGAGQAAPGAPR